MTALVIDREQMLHDDTTGVSAVTTLLRDAQRFNADLALAPHTGEV